MFMAIDVSVHSSCHILEATCKNIYTKKNNNNATMAKWFMKTMLIFNPSATYEDEERVGGG